MKTLFTDIEVMQLFADFLSDLRNGLLPAALKPYILGANLLELEKPGSTKPRPVAVGELFYRVSTSLSTSPLDKAIAEVLLPIQMGIGVPGGVETVVHFLNAMLTDTQEQTSAIAADISNAFNNRERADMLAALYKEFVAIS